MSKLSSSTLRKAAEIQGEIEELDDELRNLLTGVPRPKPQDRTPSKNFIARRARKQGGALKSGVAGGVRQILRKQGKYWIEPKGYNSFCERHPRGKQAQHWLGLYSRSIGRVMLL